jgi:YVTN family beta-propeller protein
MLVIGTPLTTSDESGLLRLVTCHLAERLLKARGDFGRMTMKLIKDRSKVVRNCVCMVISLLLLLASGAIPRRAAAQSGTGSSKKNVSESASPATSRDASTNGQGAVTKPGPEPSPADTKPVAAQKQNGKSQKITSEGIAVELALERVANGKASTLDLMEGEDVLVTFKVADARTQTPIAKSPPAAWMDLRAGDRAEKPKECRDKIKAFLGGDLSSRPMIDLNAYYVLTLNSEPSISVVDPLLGYGGSKLLALVTLKSRGEDWVLTKDQRKIFVSMPLSNQVAVIDTNTWQVISNINVGSKPARLVLRDDEKYLLVGCDGDQGEGGAAVIDTAELRVVAQIRTGAGHHEIAATGDNRFALITNKDDGTVSIIDLQKLEKVKSIKVGRLPSSIAFSAISRAAYVVNEGEGTISVIAGASNDLLTSIKAEPGIKAIRLAPGGRLGFVANPEKNLVHIIDVATNRIVQTADVEKGPYEITFTESLAYVRSRDSEIVNMIPLSQVGRGGPVPLVDFTSGQTAIGQAPNPGIADSIVASPDGPAVLVANPVDRAVYYYREGMAAPMGSFQNYGRQPRAVLVVNRSLRETMPGVYSANVRMTRSGDYDLAFLLDSPRVIHCFNIQVKPNPALKAQEQGAPIKAEYLTKDRRVKVGEKIKMQVKVVDSQTNQSKNGLKDVGVLVFLSPGIWQDRQWARPTGDGIYEISFVPPKEGVYYLFMQCPSLKVQYNQLPYLILQAVADKSIVSSDRSLDTQREAAKH